MNGQLPKLRDYQRECLDVILDRYRSGVRRQLVCLPTGTGKTVIFAEFPRYFQMKKQMLVLAHRAELLHQARDKILKANPDLKVEIEQADRYAGVSSDVVVASIQTLGRLGSKRLEQMDPDRFFLIVVDEAHHATAETYGRVLEHLGVFQDDTRKLLVGFTATPKRGDGTGLEMVFQDIVFSRSLPEMVDAGYLVPLAGYRVETKVDLSRVRTRMGDFVNAQLSKEVNIGERNALIVDVFLRYLRDKPTLCFCVDVEHAYHVAEEFAARGISATALTGKTETLEREEILKNFREGRIQVLTNCMVLTEGYDEPSVSGIILARPTKSSLLYIQMIGRGTRLYREKKKVTIIDIVDLTRTHNISTLSGLFGFSSKFDLAGHTTKEVEEAMQWVESHRPWVATHQATSLDDLRYRCRKIDLFDLKTPDEIEDSSDFAWVGVGKDRYRIGIRSGIFMTVDPTIMGTWELNLHQKVESRRLGIFPDLPRAIEFAEKVIKSDFFDSVKLVLRNTIWRNKLASSKQTRFLRDKHIEVPQGLTKGQASRLISMLIYDDPKK